MKKLCQELNKIIEPLYMVGGSVGDKILNREPKDYDFTTPLMPDEIEAKIKQAGKRAYLVGKRFGTIGTKINGQMVEITTFRNEKYNKGSRKPDVNFVKDITADLSRRDFTINAIAMRVGTGKIIDPFNGIIDIERKTIKAVGNAKTRFKEDPLRMLRVARFSSQLGFTVEKKTLEAVKEKNYKILEVSKERWVTELDKILTSECPRIGLNILAYTNVLNYIIPELSLQVGYNQNSKYHSLELWEHTLGVIDNVNPDIILRWSALLHDIAKPFVRTKNKRSGYHNYIKHDLLGAEMVEKIARHLKFSNDRREQIKSIVLNHLNEDSPLKEADDLAKG